MVHSDSECLLALRMGCFCSEGKTSFVMKETILLILTLEMRVHYIHMRTKFGMNKIILIIIRRV